MRTPVTPISLPPQGRPGVAGVQTGFGQITYTERVVTAEDSFAPNVRAQVLFSMGDIVVQDFLNPPFREHVFFAGNTIWPRAYADRYDVLLNLLVRSEEARGQIQLEIDVGSSLGPTGSDTASLFRGAGEVERVTLKASIQVLSNFLTNGARLYLTSTVPLLVTSEAILITPLSTYAGA